MMHTALRHLAVLALLGAGLAATSPSVAQSAPSDYTSATRYDVIGRVTGTISADPDGVGTGNPFLATRKTYDVRGNPIKVESGYLTAWQSESVAPSSWPAWNGTSGFNIQTTTETTYDLLNRKLTDKVKGSDGVAVSLTQYSYDSVGRLECTAVRMNTAAYGSLPSSACTLGTEGSYGPDRITKSVYDAAGQLLQVRTAVGTSIESADVTYTYTNNGKQQDVIDANGNRAELRYDGFDRQVRWVFPSTTRPSSFNDSTPATAVSTSGALNESDYELYGYDANGNRTSLRKRDGSTLTYTYDNLNRMTVKVVPSRSGLAATHTRDVYYGYDLRGLQLYARFDSASASSEGITTTYDGFGNKITETQKMDGATRTLTSAYDKDGNRLQIIYPDSGTFTYGYDGLDRLSTLYEGAGTSTWIDSFTYAPRGTLIGRSERYGSSVSWSYDSVGRLSGQGDVYATGSGNVSVTLTRNPASQIASRSSNNDSYAWNGHVNLTRGYTTNGLNQYSAAGSASFTYDANGNLTSDGTNTYVYDIENRLVSRSGGGTSVTLRYDPLGRLYEVNGSTTGITRFLNDGDAMVAEYNSSGTMLNRYAHGPDGTADDPLLWYSGATISSTLHWLHADERGSIVGTTAIASGAIGTINSYDEYGIPGSGNTGRFQYTGQAWIPELGMYYYKARIYSPTLGRFLQTDPIGYEDQYNLYAYVGNDPVNGSDPSGLEEKNRGPNCPGATGSISCHGSISPGGTLGGFVQGNGEAVGAAAARSAVGTAATSTAAAGAVLAVGLSVATGCDSPPCPRRIFVTYIKVNASTKQVYTGRTSKWIYGNESPRAAALRAIATRDLGHHVKGFGPARLDKYSYSYSAIRGREQQMIDFNGGAQSIGGTSGNKINGIWDYNLARSTYMNAATAEFGSLPNNRPDQ